MATDVPSGPRRRRRSSAASAASSTTSSGSVTQRLLDGARALVHRDSLQAWQRDNHFIRTGYRPATSSFGRSVASLGYLHNESVNIWSHLIGAAVSVSGGAWFLYRAIRPRYGSASSSDVLVFGCFFAGAVACLGMSATFHTLSNHSAHVARWGNKLDYSGIVCMIVGSYVPCLYYGFFCEPWLMTVYLYAICILGMGCGVVTWMEHFRQPEYRPWRSAMFVALGTSGVVPVLHGLKLYGWRGMEEQMSLSWVLLQGFFYIFGAFLYAFRWPERSYPETFDIWGSSHQIFHFCVLFAAASHFYGLTQDFDHHHAVMGAACS